MKVVTPHKRHCGRLLKPLKLTVFNQTMPMMVLCTSSNLQEVSVCLLKDLDILYEQQARALQDPISFVEKLQDNVMSNTFVCFYSFA